ncbi:flagella basal body P-ring formation protein FlgA [Niveispirillum lacus]|uniref:Flagella basal body P-ring formation protein FlgA n=1 Tax=Niveispirillum lacus TaxID=1981099 RepID=A0A255YZW0_9PROT|nr:flagellar basal body P-ring formation chaperone FlgA [Niveispirillum lacus]OYQ34205.1 flagella basal body P-ring formation protein FlgA [Niveispirillum lacus]
MNRFAALLIAATLLSTAHADAATLKPAATVTDGQILLGDLFDGLPGDQAMRPVMPAPAPGRRANLDAPTLSRIAASNGVEWRATGGGDRIVVERAAVQVGNDVIADGLRQALQEAGIGDGADVLMDNRTLTFFLPAGNDATVRVENLAYDAQRGRVTAEIIAPATGPEAVRHTVGARVVDMVELPVLARRMGQGEVVGEADITWIKLPRDRLQAGAVVEASEMIGKSLRRAIAPNQAVNARDVRDPVVVGKGQAVTILLQTEVMTLTASGKALTDGAQGELVRIVNTSSNRVIEAVVAGPNLVAVRPSGQIPTPVSHVSGASKKAAR